MIHIENFKINNVNSLAEEYADEQTEDVLRCRINKESIAHLGLYLGFIEGVKYAIKQMKLHNNGKQV